MQLRGWSVWARTPGQPDRNGWPPRPDSVFIEVGKRLFCRAIGRLFHLCFQYVMNTAKRTRSVSLYWPRRRPIGWRSGFLRRSRVGVNGAVGRLDDRVLCERSIVVRPNHHLSPCAGIGEGPDSSPSLRMDDRVSGRRRLGVVAPDRMEVRHGVPHLQNSPDPAGRGLQRSAHRVEPRYRGAACSISSLCGAEDVFSLFVIIIFVGPLKRSGSS